MIFGEFRSYLQAILSVVRAIQQQGTQIMSAQDIITKAMDDLKASVTADIASHKADAATLADLTAKLAAATTGATNDVDIVGLAAQIDAQAQALSNAISTSATSALNPQPTIAQTSNVQGGTTTGGDVLSASSIQVSPSQATGGATAPKDPGTQPPAPVGEGVQVPPVGKDPVSTVMATVNGADPEHVQAAVDAHAEATQGGASPADAKAAANEAATQAGADPMTAAAIVAAIPPKS